MKEKFFTTLATLGALSLLVHPIEKPPLNFDMVFEPVAVTSDGIDVYDYTGELKGHLDVKEVEIWAAGGLLKIDGRKLVAITSTVEDGNVPQNAWIEVGSFETEGNEQLQTFLEQDGMLNGPAR